MSMEPTNPNEQEDSEDEQTTNNQTETTTAAPPAASKRAVEEAEKKAEDAQRMVVEQSDMTTELREHFEAVQERIGRIERAVAELDELQLDLAQMENLERTPESVCAEHGVKPPEADDGEEEENDE